MDDQDKQTSPDRRGTTMTRLAIACGLTSALMLGLTAAGVGGYGGHWHTMAGFMTVGAAVSTVVLGAAAARISRSRRNTTLLHQDVWEAEQCMERRVEALLSESRQRQERIIETQQQLVAETARTRATMADFVGEVRIERDLAAGRETALLEEIREQYAADLEADRAGRDAEIRRLNEVVQHLLDREAKAAGQHAAELGLLRGELAAVRAGREAESQRLHGVIEKVLADRADAEQRVADQAVARTRRDMEQIADIQLARQREEMEAEVERIRRELAEQIQGVVASAVTREREVGKRALEAVISQMKDIRPVTPEELRKLYFQVYADVLEDLGGGA
ncbi:MAG TPA: hypothetical protein VFR67_06025 [Pilimelia sp.]|nr:hypothetical protein [Pilimelia sp.]